MCISCPQLGPCASVAMVRVQACVLCRLNWTYTQQANASKTIPDRYCVTLCTVTCLHQGSLALKCSVQLQRCCHCHAPAQALHRQLPRILETGINCNSVHRVFAAKACACCVWFYQNIFSKVLVSVCRSPVLYLNSRTCRNWDVSAESKWRPASCLWQAAATFATVAITHVRTISLPFHQRMNNPPRRISLQAHVQETQKQTALLLRSLLLH